MFLLDLYGYNLQINLCLSLLVVRWLYFRWSAMKSEWVSECCLTLTQQFQLYHSENKLMFNEMMMKYALYYTNTLSWIFILLAHWNNSPRIDMSSHTDTLSWFRANQSLLFPPKRYVIRGEATNTNIIVFGLSRSGLEPMFYRTRGEHVNHYTNDVVISTMKIVKQ